MEILYQICLALSGGILVGAVIGGIKSVFYKKPPSQKEIAFTKNLINKLATALKYTTLTLLGLGLLWCIYFLILGIVVPVQAEYANSMSELIVSILTVISITFAFIEFIRRKGIDK